MKKRDRRSDLREAAFLILFRADFYEPQEFKSQVKDFFEGEDDTFTEEERQSIADKVLSVIEKKDEIDAALDAVSIGWRVRRMNRVDLTILRLAYYEIKFDDLVPSSSAIDEAVELAKNYGEENSRSFVNGILAQIVKND